jgi:hypothetical protein
VKQETKYILLLITLAIFFVVVRLVAPKPLDWTPTYLSTDKNPFGAFVTGNLLDDFFSGRRINRTPLTFYELQDSVKPGENIITLSDQFNPDPESAKILFRQVETGSHAFVSAFFFTGKFADTLGLRTADVTFSGLVKPPGPDSSDLKFVIPGPERRGYYYRLSNISFYFTQLDSLKRKAHVISTNAWGKPVTLRIPWGKGYFVLNSTPLAFTNNYLLYETNYEYAEQTLSFLPAVDSWWTSYYQVGRLEAGTPLRFILNNESLRLAYFTAISCILLFILFESKRRQRLIPVVKPLSNATLEFVKTIGNMYLQANDHKSIAEKKIAYFLEQINSTYYLRGDTGEGFIQALARKSGNGVKETERLYSLIQEIQQAKTISENTLRELNQQLEIFQRKRKTISQIQ